MSNWLGQHPEIFISRPKEPHYFATDLHEPDFVDFYGERDLEEYLHLFAGAERGQKLGEGSVWYLYSRSAAEQIKVFNPGARIVIMLRNPLRMMESLHAKLISVGNEDIKNFTSALQAVPERRSGRRIPPNAWHPKALLYTDVARYSKQVGRFMDVFADEDVHVIVFDDLVNDSAGVYRDVTRFLGVDPGFTPQFHVLNRRPGPRRPSSLERALSRVKRRVTKRLTGGRRTAGPVRQRSQPEFNPDWLTPDLESMFARDLDDLSDLVGRDLTGWLPGR